MKNKLNNDFWLKDNTVKYFSDKPADFRVESRLKCLNFTNKLNALDLGCGGGRHTELLLNLGFNTWACDINQSMLDATRLRVGSKLKKARNRIKFGNIKSLPYPDDFFDVVVATGVLHQARTLKEYNKTIKELARVLKRGSVVTLNVFTNDVWDNSYKRDSLELYSVITKEGLFMTLLPRSIFYQLMESNGLLLEDEISLDVKQENTGSRAVLRANFIKI